MANKNTRSARRGSPKDGVEPNSCMRARTIGTGVSRSFADRGVHPIFKGVCCNTARKGKNRWVGALKASQGGSGRD